MAVGTAINQLGRGDGFGEARSCATPNGRDGHRP